MHKTHLKSFVFEILFIGDYSSTFYLFYGKVGGGGLPPPCTPLSLTSDASKFVQNYFGVGSIFWDKKNWDQIDNDVTMTPSLL